MSEDFQKVVIELEEDAWHGYGSEGLWAEPVGENLFKLQNSPFYAKGLSFEDTVKTKPLAEGITEFIEVVERSGNSTYRIILEVDFDTDEFRNAWGRLEDHGCTYEGKDSLLLSINVPNQADIHVVYELLEDGEKNGVWDFEEGHCGHELRQG